MAEKKQVIKGYQGHKRRVGISIEAELLQAGKKQAEKEGRNFSNLMEYLLRQYLAKK